jgi:hypothetical protein
MGDLVSGLRKQLIRLAYANPELRPEILPLLREGAMFVKNWQPLRHMDVVQLDNGRTDLEIEGGTQFTLSLNRRGLTKLRKALDAAEASRKPGHGDGGISESIYMPSGR